MLYSAGKDSSVLLHLARKAYFPGPLTFPLLHIDTGWKFRAMIAHRDRVAAEIGAELIVHRNDRPHARGLNPLEHGVHYTDVMKTEALRQALDAHGFDTIFGGARRDEEASRAKERVFSLRGAGHRWNVKAQRPELWALYNTHVGPDETLRVFPLSDWTERDIWRCIRDDGVPIAPLYFAAERPVIERNGQLLVLDDERLPLARGERPEMRKVRFRTLGCWPLTAAVESPADTIDAVLAETLAARASERQGRLIDRDRPGSMEAKKQEGYF